MSVSNSSLIAVQPHVLPLPTPKKGCLGRIFSCFRRIVNNLLFLAKFTLVFALATAAVILLTPVWLISTLIQCAKCLWQGQPLPFSEYSLLRKHSPDSRKKLEPIFEKISSSYSNALSVVSRLEYEKVYGLAEEALHRQEAARNRLLLSLEKRSYQDEWDKNLESNLRALKRSSLALEVLSREVVKRRNGWSSACHLTPEQLIAEFTSQPRN